MGAIIHFDVDGWFARKDGEFTDQNVMRVAEAAARCWLRNEMGDIAYVAYDTRNGAREAAELVATSLAGQGLSVVLSDRFAPTPALAHAVRHDPRACGGIVVTGAYYPDDYLGIKLRFSDGGMGPQEFFDAVESEIEPEPEGLRSTFSERDIVTPYLENLATLVDASVLARSGLSVVCDPMYGSARGYLPAVLGQLGIDARELHGTDDEGRADLRPEAVEPWVDDCEQAVGECDALAGLVTDGDASLMGAVDENGSYVPSSKVAALILGHLVVNRGLSGRIALSVSTSSTIKRVARSLGCPVVTRPLGFKHIYEEIRSGGVLLGTEGRGGICIPSHAPERDGMLGCALLCELMAETGKSISELVASLEQGVGTMHYGRRDLRLPVENVEMLGTMLPGMNPPRVAGRKPAAVSHMDGLRLEFEDESWLLLRPSRTTPVVRIYAEAPDVALRDALIESGCAIARGESA